MQGLTIFALQHSYELAKMLGKEKETGEWLTTAAKMKKAARRHFYDKKQGVVVSGKDKQVSYLSQVWMILSNTLDKKEGAKAMATVMSMPDACYSGCPFNSKSTRRKPRRLFPKSKLTIANTKQAITLRIITKLIPIRNNSSPATYFHTFRYYLHT